MTLVSASLHWLLLVFRVFVDLLIKSLLTVSSEVTAILTLAAYGLPIPAALSW